MLAVVGAVSALSAAAFGQTASHSSANAPMGKVTEPTLQKNAVGLVPMPTKLVPPAGWRAVNDPASFAAYKSANMDQPGFAQRGPGANNCADAPTISEGTHAYDLTGATNDWPGTCGATGTAQDVWFRYVATNTGQSFVSTCGQTAGDSVISILDECGGPQILCLDDFCGLQTEVQFPAVAGEDYLIRMADFAGGVHSGSIIVSQPGPCVLTPPGPGTPENEPCGTDTNGGCNSIPEIFSTISCNEVVSGTAWASAGTRDTDWYDLALDGPTQVTVRGQAQFPLQLFIINNVCPPTIVAAGSAGTCLEATVTAIVGGSCRIFAGNTGFDGNPCGANNDYWIQVTECTMVKGPDNDNCDSATEVTEGTWDYDLAGATNDWPGTCGATGAAQDVWFRYTAGFTGSAVVSTCGLTGGDSVITVLEECGGPQILCLDDFCGLQTEVSFGVAAGEDYYIRMAQFAGGSHAGQFNISELAPCVLTPPGPGTPENEPCGTDTNGGCNSVPPIFSTLSCGEVINGNAWASAGTRDTDWYDLALDGPHSVTITGQGQFPLQLFVLDNNCPPAIVGIASAPRCGIATVTALVGGSCRFFAGNTGFDGNPCGADNDYWIQVTDCIPVKGPSNDACADAITVVGSGPHNFDNTLASTDGSPDPLCLAFGTDQITNDLWYRWASTCTPGQDVVVSTCGQTGVDTKIAVYETDACVGPIVACNDDALSGACGLQTEAIFSAGAGGTIYTIRLGCFPGAAGGPGTFTIECDEPCLGIDPDPNGVSEGEDCGLDTNGGCNSVPNLWFDLDCNRIVNGFAWADLGTRDTDWYRAIVPDSGSVSVTVTTEVPLAVFILTIAGTDPCGAITFNAIGGAAECDTGTIAASGLVAGNNVYFFVGAGTPAGGGIFDGFPCGREGGNDYVAAFDIGEPCDDECPCDFNNDNVLNSQDFFDFLTCFFGGGCPPGQDADYNDDNVVNSQDFFDFLVCFFAPPKSCP